MSFAMYKASGMLTDGILMVNSVRTPPLKIDRAVSSFLGTAKYAQMNSAAKPLDCRDTTLYCSRAVRWALYSMRVRRARVLPLAIGGRSLIKRARAFSNQSASDGGTKLASKHPATVIGSNWRRCAVDCTR